MRENLNTVHLMESFSGSCSEYCYVCKDAVSILDCSSYVTGLTFNGHFRRQDQVRENRNTSATRRDLKRSSLLLRILMHITVGSSRVRLDRSYHPRSSKKLGAEFENKDVWSAPRNPISPDSDAIFNFIMHASTTKAAQYLHN